MEGGWYVNVAGRRRNVGGLSGPSSTTKENVLNSTRVYEHWVVAKFYSRLSFGSFG